MFCFKANIQAPLIHLPLLCFCETHCPRIKDGKEKQKEAKWLVQGLIETVKELRHRLEFPDPKLRPQPLYFFLSGYHN